MSSNSNNSPMIKATGLWQKTSVKGGQYLTGRLGGVKVLVICWVVPVLAASIAASMISSTW